VATTGGKLDPLHQFAVNPIVPLNVGGLDLSFTNASLWMVIVVGVVSAFLLAGSRGRQLVPGRMQSMVELSYEFIAGMVRENAGKEGMAFFPFIFTLFFFVLFANLLGMIPGSFTVTSHIIVTFALAAVVFVGVTVIGFIRHGAHFLTLFVPKGAPVWLLPLVVLIEVISYFVRPISLSVRLFANMLAGHTMMKVFAGFIILLASSLGALGLFVGLLPLAFIVALTGLEVLVAVLQAYVFTILTCIYLNDALHLHH
jgi:F-type H+-transporting ATPase subunit a